MSRKKYIRDSKGNVRGVATTNINLEKPLLSDNYNINVHNSNMDKIDASVHEIKSKVQELENEIGNNVSLLNEDILAIREVL